jgi:hypothetical protein
MKQIHFFGLKEDLLAMLELLESKGPLKYVRTGNFLSDEVKNGGSVFTSRANIPNLGKATADQTAGCETFLVCEAHSPVELRRFRGYDGRERICIDQLANPDSVVFTPAGMWNDDVVLNGCVGTASDSQISGALMKRFLAAVKKTCSKVRAFYVGPKAFVLLQNGKRLAGAVQSPREFDLVAEGVKN